MGFLHAYCTRLLSSNSRIEHPCPTYNKYRRKCEVEFPRGRHDKSFMQEFVAHGAVHFECMIYRSSKHKRGGCLRHDEVATKIKPGI